MNKTYRDLLILAYFKEFGVQYSIEDLKNKIGVSYMEIIKSIDILIDDGLLFIDNNKSILLTLKGRIKLGKSKLENFKYISNDANKTKAVSIDEYYLPKSLLNTKWINKIVNKHIY